jgi:hypothetical protein
MRVRLVESRHSQIPHILDLLVSRALRRIAPMRRQARLYLHQFAVWQQLVALRNRKFLLPLMALPVRAANASAISRSSAVVGLRQLPSTCGISVTELSANASGSSIGVWYSPE